MIFNPDSMNVFQQQYGSSIFPGRFIYNPLRNFINNDSPNDQNMEKTKEHVFTFPPPNKLLRIVLADDDIDDRDFFAEAISELEFKVHLENVEDGSNLLRILEDPDKVLPHLIFLDLNMPNKNGRECLDEIRKNERLKSIPVIIYSTSSSPKDIEETFVKGANLYVRKPSSFNDLLVIIRKVLSLNWDKYQPNASRKNFVFSSKTH